jgi:glycogen debranching enzyme
MADEGAELAWIQVLEGSTFMLSDPWGDVFRGSSGGLFHEDTRYLDRFALTVGGHRPALLTSAAVDYYSAAFFLTNPGLDGVPPESLSIQRFRSVGDGLTEVLVVQNHLDTPVRVEVRLECGADFADLFEVKERQVTKRGRYSLGHEPDRALLLFAYGYQDFEVASRIHSTEDARIEGDALVFDVSLEPRGFWKTRVQVALGRGATFLQPITDEDRAASRALQQWRESSKVLAQWWLDTPSLEAGWDLLKLVYQKSLEDLAALRLHADVEGNQFSLPAAGLPWFMAIFGRDTLITSYQSLLVGPDLARGALYALAALQGKEVNDFKDEEPGKILHEIRFGELTVLGDKPHRPYYGTADATPLFLVLLSEYWRITGDDRTAQDLRENAMRALEWIDRHGDLDGDGYVEYRTRSAQGLRNQGWKDSGDGVRFADGRIAEPPIAMCEIQGYVYDAKMRIAEVAEQAWGDAALATRLREEAGRLFDRFNDAFWVDERGGYYAVALDAAKSRVDSLTSNVGHLLWSGIVPQERAAGLAKQLFSPSLFTGWGVRTMSGDDVAYNPISYHNGTVWPHDNSILSAGLYRYGFRREVNRIAVAMLEAASYSGYRLPEVFAGYPRGESRFPVRYPTASSPQAWATAAPFLWLRLMLGIEVRDGALSIDPNVPPQCARVSFKGVHALGKRFIVTAQGTSGEVTPVA